jgi:hypothetical protein
MDITFIQSNQGATGNYDSATLAFVSNVVSGRLLTCSGGCWNGSSITDVVVTSDRTTGNWTTVMGPVVSGTPNRTWIAYAVATSSGACTVTINPNAGGAYSTHYIAEWSDNHATPLDVDGGSSTGASTTASDAVTTIDANTLVLAMVTHGSSGSFSITEDTGGGWTKLGEDEGTANCPSACEYQIFTSAGAKTASWTFGASLNWAAQTLSFKAAASSAVYPLVLAAGAYALTGTALTLRAARVMSLAAGTIALTGTAMALRWTARVELASGSYVLTGSALTLRLSRRLALDPGAVTLTGSSLGIVAGRALALESGSYAVPGTALTFVKARVLGLDAGSVAVTGTSLTLRTARKLGLDAGAFSLTGQDLSLQVSHQLPCAGGSYVCTGSPLALIVAHRLALEAGVLALTGSPLALTIARQLALAPGSYVFTGGELGLLASTGQSVRNWIDVEVAMSVRVLREAGVGARLHISQDMRMSINRGVAV